MADKGNFAVQRYVESLVTGNFMKVLKDIDLQGPGEEQTSDKKVQSNREFYEREMKEVQKIWVNRIHKIFHLFLGLLAGMSLMHLLVIMTPQIDKISFLRLYSSISIAINIVFMIFTSFAFILGLSLTLIYKHKSDEKMRNMDPFRMEFRQHYIVSLLISMIIAVCLGLLYILPNFTNKFFYWAPDNVTLSDISTAKGLYGATNVLFIVSWLLASAFNKASINDIDMDPDEDDREGLDRVNTTDADSAANE